MAQGLVNPSKLVARFKVIWNGAFHDVTLKPQRSGSIRKGWSDIETKILVPLIADAAAAARKHRISRSQISALCVISTVQPAHYQGNHAVDVLQGRQFRRLDPVEVVESEGKTRPSRSISCSKGRTRRITGLQESMTWLPNHLYLRSMCLSSRPIETFLSGTHGVSMQTPVFAEIQCVTESTRNTMLPRIDVFSRSGRPSWPHFHREQPQNRMPSCYQNSESPPPLPSPASDWSECH